MIPRTLFYISFIALAIGIVYYFIQDYKNFIQLDDKIKINVLIVGGGLAGLCSTIEAVRAGAHVTIIEKEKILGGNSAKATSGINGAGTDTQDKSGISDLPKNLYEDTIASGGGYSDEKLVRVLADKSTDAIRFLKSFGITLDDIVQLGGHKIARTHRIPPSPDGRPSPIGFTIVSTLRRYIEGDLKHSLTILLESSFQKLILEDGKVVGLVYIDKSGVTHELRGKVILTAGGFANDHTSDSLLTRYVPEYANLPTTNGPWATGDIIKLTAADELDLVHMQYVQVHPTGFLDSASPHNPTKFLAPEALRGVGGILLDGTGRRFVNELGRRDYVTQAIFESGQRFMNDPEMPIVSVMLLNEEMIKRFGSGAAGFYKMKGLIIEAKSLEDVATLTNFSFDVLKSTIEEYRIAAVTGEDKFGKKSFPSSISDSDQFYISYITPSLHYCMGGLSIDANARVLKKSQPVEGLFAAGEVTGGVHGENRLGGNSLLECVVFGRIAGSNAAA